MNKIVQLPDAAFKVRSEFQVLTHCDICDLFFFYLFHSNCIINILKVIPDISQNHTVNLNTLK